MAVADRLKELLSEEQVNTNTDALYDASADRYKKYAKARKALDVPPPKAIVYPNSTEEVSMVLKFCNENDINVIARSGKTATEGGLENWKENTIVLDALHLDKIPQDRYLQLPGHVQAGVALQDLEDELRKVGYTTSFTAVQACGQVWRPGLDAQHWPVLDLVWWN